MADSDKNIVITPNTGSATADPTIEFTGANNTPVTLTTLDDGTLSFSGSAGQLFSIANDLTGTIFSVNDISGVPSIEVDDDGTIRLAETTGAVLIGTNYDNGQDALQVDGSAVFKGAMPISRTERGVYIGLNASGTDPQIQLQGAGATSPHIDFCNGTEDYDARIILQGNDQLKIDGVSSLNGLLVNGAAVVTSSNWTSYISAGGGGELTWSDWTQWTATNYSTYYYPHYLSGLQSNRMIPMVFEFYMTDGSNSGTYNSKLILKRTSSGTGFNNTNVWDVERAGYDHTWSVRFSYDTQNFAMGIVPSYRPSGYTIYCRIGYLDLQNPPVYLQNHFSTNAPFGSLTSWTISTSNGYPNNTYTFGTADGRHLNNINASGLLVNGTSVPIVGLNIGGVDPTDGQVLSYSGATQSLEWTDMAAGSGGGGSTGNNWFSYLNGTTPGSISTSDKVPWPSDANGNGAALGYGGVSFENALDPNFTFCCWNSGNNYSGGTQQQAWSYGNTTQYTSYPDGMTAMPAAPGSSWGIAYTVLINPSANGFGSGDWMGGANGDNSQTYVCPPGFSGNQINHFVLIVSGGAFSANQLSGSGSNFMVTEAIDIGSGWGTLYYGTWIGTSCCDFYFPNYGSYSLNYWTMW